MNIFTNLILALYNLLFHNLGLTIIVLAIGSRIIFLPSSISMIRHQKKMQDLKPHLDAIKKKHSKDKKKQMEEQAKLFKEHGINPASGFLNAIVQIVIAIFLYQALRHILSTPSIHTNFLIWNLAKPDKYANVIGRFPMPGILVLISAIAQLALSKMMAPKKIAKEEVAVQAKKEKVNKEEKQDMTEAMTQMQSQMVFLFPIMILYTGLILPAGLALYWGITTGFAMVQQYMLVGFGGLSDWLPKNIRQKVK